MGKRLSAVTFKACCLVPDRVRDSTYLEFLRRVLRDYEMTLRSVLVSLPRCRFSSALMALVDSRRCGVTVTQAAV
jgi:hypothetical protein